MLLLAVVQVYINCAMQAQNIILLMFFHITSHHIWSNNVVY